MNIPEPPHKKTLLLDRDGVLNVNRDDYVKHWKEFQWLPSVFEALTLAQNHHYRLIVITNQSAVGRGIITRDWLDDIHSRMANELEQKGIHLSGIYVCPHAPDENCSCRKPAPGLLLAAMQDHPAEEHSCWMLGNSLTDIEAGKKAGCRTIYLGTLPGDPERNIVPDVTVDDLLQAVQQIINLGSGEKIVNLSGR